MPNTKEKYDVAVIGGGSAGMMAAITAGKNKARVVLVEKNDQLGKKILISGKGRCNITNANDDIKSLIDSYGKNGKFLYSAFNNFDNQAVIKFFNKNGLKTKVERGNRVFPVSDKALDVVNVLERCLKKNNVIILKNSPVKNIICGNNKIIKIKLSGKDIAAKNYIITTGGLSYPATGSSGDGYIWAKKIGHTIVTPKPALAPVIVKQDWVKDLEGLSLKNVAISVYQNNKKKDERQGEALFTFNGMSGPIILDMSKKIGSLLDEKTQLRIDFKPALDYQTLDKRIQKDFEENRNKAFKNSLDKLLPKKIIPIIVKLSNIDENKKVAEISKEERKRILKLLKEFSLDVEKIDGFSKAIITAGGISLNEVDPKTMKSKIIDNLSFAGEILDLDGPTGGYNLQASWSTGYTAGKNVK